MKEMKMKALEMRLQSLRAPEGPRADLEQYQTPAPLASRLLYAALGNGDIAGRSVLDPGCGNGCLSIGAAMLGARQVDGFDIDWRMVELARANARQLLGDGASHVTFGECDVGAFHREAVTGGRRWDTVAMNPPFGAQNRGADRPFLALAFAASDAVYSIHRAGTEEFVERMASAALFEVMSRETASFTMHAIFDFHSKERENVGVTLFHMRRRR